MSDPSAQNESASGDRRENVPHPPPTGSPKAADHAEMALAADTDNVVPTRAYHSGKVVGLGGSAGSLAALQIFLKNMPSDTGMTFVIVTHLAPGHASLMSEILQRCTGMPVLQVAENVKVEENHVYVIPPSKHLFMMNGHLEMADLEPERGKRVAVDLFFRTLADTHGPHAVGVILSGVDGDGSIGIKRIKERGGLTIVQEPREAEHEGMPRSAIATGMTDWVLPVAEIPGRILEYRKNENRLRLPPEDGPPISGAHDSGALDKSEHEMALREILAFLRIRTNRDFVYYKRATILRRIGRRMQVNALANLDEYLTFLRTHHGEAEALLQDLLISVTNFFRDSDAFAALQNDMPNLFGGKRGGDQVRVWVAGCATGEEAYSIAILLKEFAEGLKDPPSLQIFATDLDDASLQQARLGIYPETIAADVSEERLRRFFHRDAGRLRIRTELRECVLFSLHDLFKDAPFSRLDLISCRNLFIYVNRETQRRAFDLFHFALRPNGRLFLGSAESAEDVSSLFSPINKRQRLYTRSPGMLAAPPPVASNPIFFHSLPVNHTVHPQTAPGRVPPRERRKGGGMAAGEFSGWRDVHFEFLDGIAPASVLINSDYHIMHLSERAGQWLTLSSGEPSNDLLEMVPPSLRVELRTALFRAAQDGGIIDMPCLPLDRESGGAEAVRLRVRALDEVPGYFLVAFDHGEAAPPETVRVYPLEEQWTVRQLEEELSQTRLRLRYLEEQHRASLEELKAGNEELQSMNEELRSAGEELETGREEMQSINEEMQSINEELQTVNNELKVRVEELSASNSDLQNLMASTNIATIFLDRELRIKRYTPPAMALFNFIPSDLGRPLSDLTNRLEYPGITVHAQSVLDHLVPIEKEVQAADRWFLARLQPYRTLEDHIGGVVLTFVDITPVKQAEQALSSSKEHLRLIFENAREYAIFSMDTGRRVTSWNSGAERLLGYMEAEILGQSADVIFTPEDRAGKVPQIEAGAALENGRAADERWHLRRDSVRFWGSGAMMAMHDVNGKTIGLLKILRDQTDERRVLDDLRKARADAEAAGKAKDRFIAVLSHELRTPLSPVIMGIDMLLEEEVPDAIRGTLEMLSRNVRLEVQLIDDLLDVTRITHGKLEITRRPVDVHDVIKKALLVCGPDLRERNQKVDLSLDAVNHRITGDEMRLQQIFWNVLKNAAKFTPRGGEISISSRNEDSNILIHLADNGIGMDPARLETIFDAFHQGEETTQKYGGLGLGLAISKAVAIAHGGDIRAESPGEGKGAVFTLTLPLSPQA